MIRKTKNMVVDTLNSIIFFGVTISLLFIVIFMLPLQVRAISGNSVKGQLVIGNSLNMIIGSSTQILLEGGTITGVPSSGSSSSTPASSKWTIPSFSEVLNNAQDKLSKLPFFDMFAHASSDVDSTHPNGGGTNPDSNSGITVYGLYMLMGGAVVLSLGAWIALLTGSRIVLLMSLVIMMAIFVAPLFSAWMVIVLIIGGLAILYLVRQG
jgi:hypothetical protein